MSTTNTVTRFDLKLDVADKAILCRAASLMGTSMAGFVRVAAKEKAQALLNQELQVQLSQRDFVALHAALDHAFEPNPALQRALQAAAQIKRA